MTEQIDWLAIKATSQADVSPKIRSIEELETLPAGTKTRTSHHRLPGGERHRKRKRSTNFLDRTRKPYGALSIRPTLELFQRQH